MLPKAAWFFALFVLLSACFPAVAEQGPAVLATSSPAASRWTELETVEQEASFAKSTNTPPPSQEPPQVPTPPPTAEAAGEPKIVGAKDPRIRYIGRFDFSNSQEVYFDWSGAAIEANFSGPYLAILLEDGANSYNVSIDKQTNVLETVPGKTKYQIAQNLLDGPHVVRITKRTEAFVGGATFSGFIVGAGHELLEKPADADRSIEFIGDSITTGYGIEGESPDCWFTARTQNVDQTYAALTARHFAANYSIVALSGLGVVRNLRADETQSPETAIDFVDRAVAMNPRSQWNPENSAPDAVIVNLGTNDFSSLPQPDYGVFVDAYMDLLGKIRDRYPRTTIFALSGPLMLAPAPSAIREAVDRLRSLTKDEALHTVEISDTLDSSGADFGCDWHPNIKGHIKIADQLVPVLAEKLDW